MNSSGIIPTSSINTANKVVGILDVYVTEAAEKQAKQSTTTWRVCR
jgi:hypothetical protein